MGRFPIIATVILGCLSKMLPFRYILTASGATVLRRRAGRCAGRWWARFSETEDSTSVAILGSLGLWFHVRLVTWKIYWAWHVTGVDPAHSWPAYHSTGVLGGQSPTSSARQLCRAGFAISTSDRSAVFFWEDFSYSGGHCNGFKYFEIYLLKIVPAGETTRYFLSPLTSASPTTVYTLDLSWGFASLLTVAILLPLGWRVPIIIPCWNDPNSTRLSVSGCLFFNCCVILLL